MPSIAAVPLLYLAALLHGLGSDDFQTRQACTRELVRLNNAHDLRHFIALAAAARDPEVRQRARRIAEAYRAVCSPYELKPGLCDVPRWVCPGAWDQAMKDGGYYQLWGMNPRRGWAWTPYWYLSAEEWRDARGAFVRRLFDRGWTRQQVQAVLQLAGANRRLRDTLLRFGLIDSPTFWAD